jgi:all-trans-8'-apo-beta-carotenal 15,15'-oxygenase
MSATDPIIVPSCHRGLENLDQEFSYWIDQIEGEVPPDLEGTFFRNGPGRQKIGGQPYGHWFDGDGMVCAFSFINGKVHFKNAYVRTPKYLEETAEQEILYRGFGTQIPGGLRANFLKKATNPVNTSVIYHGGVLLALNEGGRPWALEPATLDTVGEFDYDGMLSSANSFSAHGKVHPDSGDYINFGAGISGFGLKGVKACLNVYRINPQGAMIKKGEIPLANYPFCHDFALTEHYAIFCINSIVFGGMLSYLIGRKSISEQVAFNKAQPMKFIVLDLDSFGVVRTFETEPGAIIHFGNAFEQGTEIVIDGMHTDNFEVNQTLGDVFNPEGRFGGGTYHRYTLDMASGSLRCDRVSELESEFPTFNPSIVGKKHRACYTACSIDNGADSFFNAFQKVQFDGESTLETLPPGCYASEPMFAPSTHARQEDHGYLLVVVYNAHNHQSELQIYRAEDVTERVCRLQLKHHIPHQFHGHFAGQVFIDS